MKWLSVAALLGAVNALSIPRADSKGIFPDDGKSCGTTLTDPFEFPHLIVPVDESNPDLAPGTSYEGEVSEHITSLFNFDIPAKDELSRCTLVFLFPSTSERPSETYTFEGDGNVQFDSLKEPALESTTYNNAPEVEAELGEHVLQPGTPFEIASFPCPQGQRIGFQVSNKGTTNFKYFQDYSNPP